MFHPPDKSRLRSNSRRWMVNLGKCADAAGGIVREIPAKTIVSMGKAILMRFQQHTCTPAHLHTRSLSQANLFKILNRSSKSILFAAS
ncbi:hypothetical protein [Microseira wollei]|uniref:hypothetical protein n=1 Tax=Microseira wollei TaxID=467598 RepID=UPI001CFE1DD6|nr:hypothetical protein [Microseira wollei]